MTYQCTWRQDAIAFWPYSFTDVEESTHHLEAHHCLQLLCDRNHLKTCLHNQDRPPWLLLPPSLQHLLPAPRLGKLQPKLSPHASAALANQSSTCLWGLHFPNSTEWNGINGLVFWRLFSPSMKLRMCLIT